MGQKLDEIVFSTGFEAYKNRETTRGSIVIPADTIPNLNGSTYFTTIPFARAGARADIYLRSANKKVIIPAGSPEVAFAEVYQATSTEDLTLQVQYYVSLTIGITTYTDVIYIAATIDNFTGGSITLVSQTISVDAVQYDAPITAI